MRIAVLGAGPAGLYFSILMKKADPAHEIVVLERNPPDATFGWGVVFSEETLGRLRDADEPTHEAITGAFATWSTIDVHYRGRTIRSRGHGFSAISRKLLLGLLQTRARELGVELRFGADVQELAQLPEADLVVGADGVNSLVRRTHADALRPSVRTYPTRFAWFGTDLVLDAFTFAFTDTEHGLFQAHAYPFDATLSTFIVETREDTWARAGLDAMDEDASIAFCERLFAPVLRGHRLLSNRSIWLAFNEVHTADWSTGRTVLVGDSAHTAHFSIGSGTKLAMEDAIELAFALARHGDDVRPALVEYELERRPVVERFQEAARQSAEYFEDVPLHWGLAPVQFAFNLLTRSGRIGHANLTLRDPALVRRVDAFMAAGRDAPSAGGAAAEAGGEVAEAGADGGRDGVVPLAAPPFFAPLRLGSAKGGGGVERGGAQARRGVELRNRGVVAGLEIGAAAGAGLVVTPGVAVSADGRITPECPVMDDAGRWREPVARVHAAGAKAMLALSHAGRRGATRPRSEGVDLPLRQGGWPLVSASPIPYTPRSAVPRELDEQGMARVRDAFAAAAALGAEAGFDVLELNLGQGYLLGSFLSPLSNRRDDAYGGALAARTRFPLAVVAAVRDAWPGPLAARLSVTDWSRRGLQPGEAVEIAAALRDAGCELIHVTAGQTTAEAAPEYRRGHLTAFSDHIRSEARVRTLVGGYLDTLDAVNTIVGAGRSDLCLLEPAALS